MNSLSSARAGLRPVLGRLLSQPTTMRSSSDGMDRLDRLAHHPERIAESEVAGVDRGQRHQIRVGDLRQVDDGLLLDEAGGVDVAQIDHVDVAEQGRQAPAAIALDQHETIVGERRRVGDEVGGVLDVVLPRATGELLVLGAELEDVAGAAGRCRRPSRPRGSRTGTCRSARSPSPRAHGCWVASPAGRRGTGCSATSARPASGTAGRAAGPWSRSGGSTARTRRPSRSRRCGRAAAIRGRCRHRSAVDPASPSLTIGKPITPNGSRNSMN